MPDPSLSPADPRSTGRGTARPSGPRPLAAPPARVAFEVAYREHAGAVFALAHRLVKDRALAEEVAQEVFLRLWRRPDRFDPARGCLRSFLLADCRGRAIDAIRAETARRRREERDGRSSGLHVVDDVADRICDRAVRADVGLLLEALPEVERAAISLACATSVTYREVAATLGIPEGTAKARIRSGLRRMRAQIGDVSTNEATR